MKNSSDTNWDRTSDLPIVTTVHTKNHKLTLSKQIIFLLLRKESASQQIQLQYNPPTNQSYTTALYTTQSNTEYDRTIF